MNNCKIGADLHLDVMPQDGVRKYLTLSQPGGMRSYLLPQGGRQNGGG